MTLDSKFDIESVLYSVGYILVCTADIFRIEWLNYIALCCAVAAAMVLITIIRQYSKLTCNDIDRHTLKKKIIYKSVFVALLIALAILSLFI